MQVRESPPPKSFVSPSAAGRTGKLVFSKLLKNREINTTALVRTEKSAKRLIKDVKCGLDHVVVCDVTGITDLPPRGLEGAEAMIVCTSAVPIISKFSLVKAVLKIPFNVLRGGKAFNSRSMRFKYRPGQYPQKVDYEGLMKQVDLAKTLGVDHVVVVR